MTGIKPKKSMGRVRSNSLRKFLIAILTPLNNNLKEEEFSFSDIIPVKSSSMILDIGPIKGADKAIIRYLNTIKPMRITIIAPSMLLML